MTSVFKGLNSSSLFQVLGATNNTLTCIDHCESEIAYKKGKSVYVIIKPKTERSVPRFSWTTVLLHTKIIYSANLLFLTQAHAIVTPEHKVMGPHNKELISTVTPKSLKDGNHTLQQ